MAFTPINVGTAANDNTGDQNRTGWQKVNANFVDAQAQLNTKASAANLTTEIADRTSDVAAIIATLATKADLADVIDPGTVEPRFDAPQTIINDQRRQLAENEGGYVTLPFQLQDAATDAATGTYYLPMFPQNFILCDFFLMLHRRTIGTGGTLTGAFTLDQGATNIGGAASGAITGAGKMQGIIAVLGRRITKELNTTCALTITSTETGSPVAKGATLWLRGVWEA